MTMKHTKTNYYLIYYNNNIISNTLNVLIAYKDVLKHYFKKKKVLHDAIEEPFCLNGSIKKLLHLKNLSVLQKEERGGSLKNL